MLHATQLDLASRLRVDVGLIHVVSSQFTIWSDSSPGWKIILDVGGIQYEYETSFGYANGPPDSIVLVSPID